MTDEKNNLVLLKTLEGKSGVYFISPDLPSSPTEKFLVKIGLAVAKPQFDQKQSKRGLKSRLESYLMCYPRGFYIFGIMFTTKANASRLERSIHSYLSGKGRKSDYPHSRIEEWYNMSLVDIQKTILIQKNVVRILKHKLFVPPHFLVSNPTAGKQKILVPKSTPERRKIESKTSISPPHTTKKKKYRKSKSVKKKLFIS